MANPNDDATPEDAADESKSVAERVEAVRVELFDSMAMVDVAVRAISPDRDWCLRHMLEVIGRQINAACATLELIAGDARDVQVVPAATIDAITIAEECTLGSADRELILLALDLFERHIHDELAKLGNSMKSAAMINMGSRLIIVRAKVTAIQGVGRG